MHVTRSPVTKKRENFELSHQKEKDLVHFSQVWEKHNYTESPTKNLLHQKKLNISQIDLSMTANLRYFNGRHPIPQLYIHHKLMNVTTVAIKTGLFFLTHFPRRDSRM